MVLTTTIWSLIFVGAASLWWRRLRPLSIGTLGAGYLLALGVGLVDWRAIIAIGLLIALVWVVKPERSIRWRVAGHVAFLMVALGLGMHALPDFP